MAKWRKKPIVVEADPYEPGMEDGFDNTPISRVGRYGYPVSESQRRPYIETLEGRHFITKGDYIITGVKNERYPCKADIFLASYGKVEE